MNSETTSHSLTGLTCTVKFQLIKRELTVTCLYPKDTNWYHLVIQYSVTTNWYLANHLSGAIRIGLLLITSYQYCPAHCLKMTRRYFGNLQFGDSSAISSIRYFNSVQSYHHHPEHVKLQKSTCLVN